VAAALRAGARAYVSKRRSVALLQEALEMVCGLDGRYVEASLHDYARGQEAVGSTAVGGGPSLGKDPDEAKHVILEPRERQVLKLISEGALRRSNEILRGCALGQR
jgi:DNA-binding NarL/FixJ family response regulator